MQVEDIVSPTYSVNSNVLKLNLSSVASSTPGCQNFKGPFVFFEQFAQDQNPRNSLKGVQGKKRLTIQIDESYDFPQHSQPAQSKVSNPMTNNEDISTPQANTPVYDQSKIQKIMAQLISQAQQIENWKMNFQLIKKQQKELFAENQQLKASLHKKQEIIIFQQQKNEEMAHKIAQLEEDAVQDKFYDEKLRQKENKIRQIQKMNDKLVVMNKGLQRQLNDSDKKIMELQKQIQRSVCMTQYQNLAKIKESSSKMKESSLKVLNMINKENTFTNIPKSVDRKKINASQVKKTGRITSSTSTTNIAKKIQVKNSLI